MTPTQFIASLPEPRRSEVRRLHRTVRTAAPGLRPVVDGRAIGYGPYHYRYASGREGDTFVVAVANLKQAISLYVMGTRGERWLPELYADRLGKASCGKCCVRIRKVDDVDLDVVAEMVREAAALHGTPSLTAPDRGFADTTQRQRPRARRPRR